MGTRQYIGARYVPKFDGEWNSEKVYEPLTIVEYNNATYTSKKLVPSGITPTNTEYWAITGTLNGQITELIERVDSLEDNVEELKETKGILLIGDSFTQKGSETNWADYLETATGKTVYNFAMGGAGFYHKGSTGTARTFSEQVSYAHQTISDDMIDTVIVYGGVNDFLGGVTQSNLRNGISALSSVLYTYYPNAKKIVAPFNCGLSKDSMFNDYEQYYAENIQYFRSFRSWSVCENVIYWLCPYPNGVFNSDNLHPNNYGHELIASYMIQILNGTYIGVDKVIYANYVNKFKGTLHYVNGMVKGNLTIENNFNVSRGWNTMFTLPNIGFGNDGHSNQTVQVLTANGVSTEIPIIQINTQTGIIRFNSGVDTVNTGGYVNF